MTEVAVINALLNPEAGPLWGSNISETGMFVQTTRPPRLGERVSLRFDLDHGQVEVKEAEVVWIRPFEPIMVDGHLPGCGLEFIDVDDEAQFAIRSYVERRLAPISEEAERTFHSIPVQPFDSVEHPLSDWRLEVMPRPDQSFVEERERQGLGDVVPETITLPPAPREITLPPAHAAIFDHDTWGALDDALEDDPAFADAFNAAVEEATRSLEDDLHVDEHVYLLMDRKGTAVKFAAPTEDDDVAALFDEAHRAVEAQEHDDARDAAGDDDDVSAADEDGDDVFAPVSDDRADPSDWQLSVSPHDTDIPMDAEPSAGHRFFAAGEALEADDDSDVWAMDEAEDEASSEPSATDRELMHTDVIDREPKGLRRASARDELGGVRPLPPRRGKWSVTRSGRFIWATAFVLAGSAGGVFIGLTDDAPATASNTAAPSSAVVDGTMASVATLEAELPTVDASAPAPAAAALVDAPVPQATAEAGDALPRRDPVKVASTREVSKAPTAAPVVPVEKAEAPPAATKAKPEAVLTNPVAAAAKPAANEADARQVPGLSVAEGSVSIALSGGEVVRAFALGGPSRVVVDLAGASYPGFYDQVVQANGVGRVRIGRPDPDHVRVVVELSRDAAPEGISTLKRSGTLAISWR